MTRPRPKPTAPPLAATLRQALAQGWHTLDALEALAGRATGARLRVHAALAELRAAGVVLEERVERGVAEVRLLTLPAPVPDDPRADLDATIVDLAREAQEMGLPVSDGLAEASDELGLSEEDTERLRPVWVAAFERRRAEREEAERALDAPDPLREPSPPVEGEPVDAASYYLGRGRSEEDADLDAVRAARGRDLRNRVIASLPPGATPREIMFAEAAEIVRMRGPVEPATAFDAPAPPRESSAPVALTLPAPRPDDGTGDLDADDREAARVAIAEEEAALDEAEGEDARAHCSPRGKPKAETIARVAAALDAAPPKGPGPGSRCARPGCGKRFDQHGAPRGTVCPFLAKPRGRPRVAPASQRLAAVQADDPDVTELPTVAEQAAILAGARAAHEAAVEEARVERAEPETSRGEAPGDQANGKQEQSEATDVGTTDDGAEGSGAAPHPASGGKRARVRGQHAVHERVSGEVEGAGRRAPRRSGKADEPVGLTRPPRCHSVWHDVQCEREAGHPCDSEDEPGRHHSAHGGRSGWTDEAAAGWAQRRAEEARETTRGGRGKRAPVATAKPVPCRPPACHADDIHVPSAVRAFARPLCERHRRWVEEAGGTVAAGGLAGVVEQVRAGAKETV